MKLYYESKEAKCPFYLHERQQVISCESSIEGALTHITFPHVSLQRAHEAKYCYTMKYEGCPHYRAVMQRYDEAENTLKYEETE